MASVDQRNSERYERARDKADRAGEKAKGFLGIVAAAAVAVAAFLGHVVPWLAATVVHVVGVTALAVGAVALALALTIRRSSDEPHERVGWTIVFFLVVAALVYFMW